MGKRKKIQRVPFEDLKELTNNFSEENYIGSFQFGKVYRGRKEVWVPDGPHFKRAIREITVKMWEASPSDNVVSTHKESRLMDEFYLLQHEKINYHPTLVELSDKYCCEGDKFGIVYELESLDTVHNLLDKDDFTWVHRMRVAFGIASLLKLMHVKDPIFKPMLLRNLDAAHIMIDKDYNPKLIDFGMITGGIFPDRTRLKVQYGNGGYGYEDPCYGSMGVWSEKSDVFTLGVLLLMLISKRGDPRKDKSDASSIYDWAWNQYKPKKSFMGSGHSGCSLVHKSLRAQNDFRPHDGEKVTKLAMQCIQCDPEKRPTMRKVALRLRKIHVLCLHARTLGLDNMLLEYNYKLNDDE